MLAREPGLLLRRNGEELTLKSWAEQIINSMKAIAKMLDSIHFTRRYTQVLALQPEKIADANLTPSGQVLNDIKHNYSSFFDFAISKARQRKCFFKHLVQNQNSKMQFEHQAAESIIKQKKLKTAI